MNLERNSPETLSGDPTRHFWDHSRRTVSSSLNRQPTADDWEVRVTWTVVNGEAVPYRFEVHSVATPPAPVTRELFKALPVGHLLNTSRQSLRKRSAHFAEWEEEWMPGESERIDDALAVAKPPSRSDWKYRETAKAYTEAMDDPEAVRAAGGIAKETHRRLVQKAMKARPGSNLAQLVKVTETRTRKDIAKARELGYLPPAPGRKRARNSNTEKNERNER